MISASEDCRAVELAFLSAAFSAALLVLWFATAILKLRHIPLDYGP
jgi:hypothetical protein